MSTALIVPTQGLDASITLTAPPSKYNLNQINISEIDAAQQLFVDCLIRYKHLLFHWGESNLWACLVPFRVDYDQRLILIGEGQDPVSDDSWVECSPEDLWRVLRPFFEGNPGISTVDLLVRLERSGVRVDLCGTETYGPANPAEFMEALRAKFLQQ